MTTKYESVLSEADKKEIIESFIQGFIGGRPRNNMIEITEQKVLAKLQPQLDAIGAGGVSGQRVMKTRTPEGYKLVPIDPSVEQINAMRTGSYKDYPSDELCRVRYAAMIAAAPAVKDSLTTENQELRIVFSGEAPNLTFIDVENEDGFSVNAGKWHNRFDGYTELRIKAAKE